MNDYYISFGWFYIVYFSTCSHDIGSTYFNFVCAHCHTIIGRYYLTTSSDLDSLREKFSFLIDEISSYELGKSQLGKIPDVAVETDHPDQGTGQLTGMCSGCAALGDELLKVFSIM